MTKLTMREAREVEKYLEANDKLTSEQATLQLLEDTPINHKVRLYTERRFEKWNEKQEKYLEQRAERLGGKND